MRATVTVKMLVATYWGGMRLKPGDSTEVDDRTGARWADAGIAEKVTGKSPAMKTETSKE